MWLDRLSAAAMGRRTVLLARSVAGWTLATGLMPYALASNPCLQDVNAAHALVRAHDAGADAHWATHADRIEATLQTAQRAAAAAPEQDACLDILAHMLKAWRKGHLAVAPAPTPPVSTSGESTQDTSAASNTQRPQDPNLPQLQRLNSHTVLLRIPSFNHAYRLPLEALLARIRPSDRHWLIDLRGNGGGGDSTFATLLDRLRVSELRTPGWRYRASPEAIAAHQRVCPMFAPDDPVCARDLQSLVARLQAAPAGEWVQVPSATPAWRAAPPQRQGAPRRVLVLADGDCASSCEQFLLAARQSANVKLAGQPSFGALDYSDLRPFPLPSGRLLFLATSRSERLPAYAIDGVGVPPDILLPAPRNEAERLAEQAIAERWLRAHP